MADTFWLVDMFGVYVSDTIGRSQLWILAYAISSYFSSDSKYSEFYDSVPYFPAHRAGQQAFFCRIHQSNAARMLLCARQSSGKNKVFKAQRAPNEALTVSETYIRTVYKNACSIRKRF